MSESYVPDSQTAIYLTAEIVSAYVSGNAISSTMVPDFIKSVHRTLTDLAAGGAAEPAVEEVEKPTAAQIRKSITPDALISFIDGRPYKTLKRHLTKHGLDPASYRARYGLPENYPSTAANYSAHRSELARQLGLGQRPPSNAPPANKRPARQAAE